MKNSTSQMASLCFEDICGVRIKHLSPPKCTEGANLCPTAPVTSGFSSAPRDHSLKLSLCFQSCPRGKLWEQGGHRFVEPQLSKYPNTDAGRCQPSLPQLQPAGANAATAPQAGQEAADTAVLNTNSLLTWQTKRLLHSPPGRASASKALPCSRQGFPAPLWVSYLALHRSCCRMLLLGDVLSQTPADPLLLLLGVSLQT